jgi:hypothetical protein
MASLIVGVRVRFKPVTNGRGATQDERPSRSEGVVPDPRPPIADGKATVSEGRALTCCSEEKKIDRVILAGRTGRR